MKSNLNLKPLLVTGIIALLICFLASVSNAQQPKGKPWHAPEAAAKVKNPTKSDDEYVAGGKALYSKHCKSCHGSAGKGDGPKSANLEISCGDFTSEEFKAETEGAIYWKTSEGRDPMPTFKKKISDEERWQIVAYIKTLGPKK